MTTSYDAWNSAISQHFFAPQSTGQTVFLTVDEDTLWRMSRDYGAPLQFASAEQAVNDFIASVRDEIYLHGWTLGALQRDTYPRFLGLLALQVLAVFNMGDYGEFTASAYWGRVRELLHDNTSYMPLGLTGDLHQRLWRQGLERWANVIQEECCGVVRLPSPKQSGERHDHVSLPKSQALFSQADLLCLPTFYDEADFRPGEDLEVEILQREVERCLDKPSLFRRHAQRVLRDDRSYLACVQIRDHLRQWDGHDRGGTARLWLQLRDYDPPELDGGLITKGEAIREVGLGDVIGRSVYPYALHRVFRPLHDRYYVTVRDGDALSEVWHERRYAKPGDDVLLLLRSGELSWRSDHIRYSVAENEQIEQYHAQGEMRPRDSIPLKGLPRGWDALRFRVCQDLRVTLPLWCEEWLHYAPLQLIEGLRIGKQRWMAGAGPTVLVRASDVTTVSIDSRFYNVINHRVTPYQAPCLDEPGIHIVQVAGDSYVQCTIAEDARLAEILKPSGWVYHGPGWPSPEWLRRKDRFLGELPTDGLTLCGPVLHGQSLPSIIPEPSVQQQWVEMLQQLRGCTLSTSVSAPETQKASSHPLIRQLQMIARGQHQLCPRNI